MAKKSPRTVLYRRAREQKTDYKKRLRLLLSGRARLVIRVTNRRIIGQLLQFGIRGDTVIAATDSFSLRRLGWTNSLMNVPAAYFTGLLLGKKGLAQGCTKAIVDTGFRPLTKKGRICALVKGVVDAGMEIPYDPKIFPGQDRLEGKHLKSIKAGEFSQFHQKIMGSDTAPLKA